MTIPSYNHLICAEMIRRFGCIPRGIWHTQIMHDDWCGLLRGRGPCNCDPEIGYIWPDGTPSPLEGD